MTLNYSGMILAAGFGKRMMPLTKNIPKPLISINGITLLDNAIDFLKKLGCRQIIINTHYHHLKIEKSISKRKDIHDIKLIYEKEILDTAGAVKNAIPYFKNENLLIINSDIFWRQENIKDAQLLINNCLNRKLPHLLLAEKTKSFGMVKSHGDFILNKKKILRFEKGNEIFFYSGLQMITLDILNNFSKKSFSFNQVWDDLISKKKLCGEIMTTNWYHVGDESGLTIAKKLDS
jgi:MurNAc alpha-1-phosphate uridylyltransferase